MKSKSAVLCFDLHDVFINIFESIDLKFQPKILNLIVIFSNLSDGIINETPTDEPFALFLIVLVQSLLKFGLMVNIILNNILSNLNNQD